MMEDKQQEMLDLLDEIYWNEGYSYGIDYFSQFLHKMEKYDFAKMLACQTKFSVEYVLSFILSTPSLWINLSDTDWIRIMSVLNPRPKPFSIEIFDAGYVDIHFLCKYMRLNAIELFLQQDQFSNEDKKMVLQYSSTVAISLFMNEFDLENLDGNYYLHQDELEKVRLSLISNGEIKPLNYTEDELSEYIKKELKVYE
ncbi:MAG: hypothetical protein V7K55_23650 [Nostoc sp.]|uniref:hypothetical protein n=1 Tax=Nostoc sp. TaxID=1180 RepID=UPI002FF95AAD